MPTYKLCYFDVRGWAETARIILNYAGQEFEDKRWKYEQMAEMKAESETGFCPWLEVDGERIYEVNAINRYLGTIYGLAGKDAMENAQIDSLVDTYRDFLNDAKPYYLVKSGRGGTGTLEELEPRFNEVCERWYTYLLKRIEKVGSGFIASKLSWGDIFFAEGILTFTNVFDIIEKKYPKLVEYKNLVFSQPKIKEYIEKRPEQKW